MSAEVQDLLYGPETEKEECGTTYMVPREQQERLRLREIVLAYVADQHLVAPLLMHELEAHADCIVAEQGVDSVYREFLFILINNAVWVPVVRHIPCERRTLMLPPCLRATGHCKATFDELGLLCDRCGGCLICDLSEQAEDMGYTVLVAEGTTIVGALVEQGKVDAVIGVGCMAALERTFPRMVASAVPGVAVPLLQDGCADTSVDRDWVSEALHLLPTDEDDDGFGLLDLAGVQSVVHGWFALAALRDVLRVGDSDVEQIGFEWLARSGKRWRPFLTTAVSLSLMKQNASAIPDHVRLAAIAMECIHKASLVYDDIQDEDDMRYGAPTLHQVHGVPVAMTVSLYLLGLGYRLLAECGATDAQKADMLFQATDGHCRLCLGQGDELIWTRSPSVLTSEEVLQIFREKTAPSFEVVLELGGICAGADASTRDVNRRYSEELGVAYQIRDDLDDFTAVGDVDDILAQRPSVVLALAHEMASPELRGRIASVWKGKVDKERANEIRTIIAHLGVVEQVEALLCDYQDRALRALAPLGEPVLKMTLFRIARLVFARDS